MLLLLLLIDSFTLIKTFNKRETKPIKETKPKLTKEEKDKQKQIKESFENLMNYDEYTARRRK